MAAEASLPLLYVCSGTTCWGRGASVNVSSMVEKETLAPEERPLVAAVIYNRLHAHMPLGIDATLRYGLNIPPTKSITLAICVGVLTVIFVP